MVAEIERATNAISFAAQLPAGETQPIITTSPSRQAKKKKKSSIAQKEQEDIGTVAGQNSTQRSTVEPAEWSQSSATEAIVSQGQMELLLVVRYEVTVLIKTITESLN